MVSAYTPRLTMANNDDFDSLDVKAGDIVIFNSFLVHGSRKKEIDTDSIRWSLHYRYNDASERDLDKKLKFIHPYKVYHPDQEIR